jgi:hypothetical protein
MVVERFRYLTLKTSYLVKLTKPCKYFRMSVSKAFFFYVYMVIELVSNNRKIKLTKEDGSIVFISACKWKDLDNLHSYISELLKYLIECDGYIGKLLCSSNTGFWSIIDSVCGILVSDGEKITKDDFLWSEDYQEVITTMFLTSTTTLNLSGAIQGTADPSYLSVINGLDFFTMLSQALQNNTQKEVESN